MKISYNLIIHFPVTQQTAPMTFKFSANSDGHAVT